ncbi:SPOR domain-containing protein [Pseudoduganella sp. UC29_106]|uniref:SPOR domain-containing protein n=1 Tax=Pseudoduganella sp. UC29_106 TaxID=3374553 RepID=UPI0037574F38
MLKLIFLLLLAANAALFAYGKGYLGNYSGNEHEPARVKNQQNADKLHIITAEQANAAVAAAAPPAPVPRNEAAATACLEVGNFVMADARRFEERVAPLELGDRQVRKNLPGQEISSYIVHIPPQGSKEAADKKAAELRALGVTNYFIMNESSPLRWGISLGVFRSETAAQSQLATLVKQGVHNAKVVPRYTGSKQLLYQFRDISADTKARLEKIAARFPDQETRACSK